MEVLDRYRIASAEEEEGRHLSIRVWNLTEDMVRPFWNELRDFCKGTGVSLHEVIVNLRFGFLD
jgi:hypothetical protein